MLEDLIWVDYAVFGHAHTLNLLDNDAVLLFDIVVEKSMVVLQLDVFAKQSKLVPLDFVTEFVFSKVFFEFVNSDPRKILSSKGRTFFLSFGHLIFKCQLNLFYLFL